MCRILATRALRALPGFFERHATKRLIGSYSSSTSARPEGRSVKVCVLGISSIHQLKSRNWQRRGSAIPRSALTGESRARPLKLKLSTLHPHRLQATDLVDLSGALVVEPFQLLNWSYHRLLSDGTFPPGSRGFFYYHQPPNLPTIAGEIRFRLTPTDVPTSFHLGTDLMTKYGMPWRYQIFRTAHSENYRRLWDGLLRDGLVTREMQLECQKYLGSPPRFKLANDFLFAFDQPFPFTFGSGEKHVHVVARGKIVRLTLGRLFLDQWVSFTQL